MNAEKLPSDAPASLLPGGTSPCAATNPWPAKRGPSKGSSSVGRLSGLTLLPAMRTYWSRTGIAAARP